jgi:hypothetical protein
MVKVRVKTTDLDRTFRAIPEEFDKEMESAFEECGKAIVEEAQKAYRKNFLVITGQAIGAIEVKKVTEKKVEVGLDTKVKHAIYLHEGTKAHWIEPVEAEALHWTQYGKHFFSKGHIVSGIKGVKFLEIGIQKAHNKCVKIVEKFINKAFKNAGL